MQTEGICPFCYFTNIYSAPLVGTELGVGTIKVYHIRDNETGTGVQGGSGGGLTSGRPPRESDICKSGKVKLKAYFVKVLFVRDFDKFLLAKSAAFPRGSHCDQVLAYLSRDEASF